MSKWGMWHLFNFEKFKKQKKEIIFLKKLVKDGCISYLKTQLYYSGKKSIIDNLAL